MYYKIARLQVLKNKSPNVCMVYLIEEDDTAIRLRNLQGQGYKIISTFTQGGDTYLILEWSYKEVVIP